MGFYDILKQFRQEHRFKDYVGHRDDVYFRYDATPSTVYARLTVGATGETEIANSGGNIIIDSAGDIVLEAAGGDLTLDAQLTLTNTGADQLLVRYDESNLLGVDVDSDGSTTLTTTGTNADFEIATGTDGAIILDSASSVAIEVGSGYMSVNALIESTVAAGSPMIKANATNDAVRNIIAESGTGGFVFSASAAGWLEILIGADARYIPFWAI